MTIVVIGSGDLIAFPKLDICQSSLGADVHYTSASYSNFFSEYGFAVPLNYEAIPYNLAMDNVLPKVSNTVARFENVCNYLLVEHNGHVWNVSLMLRNEGNKLSHSYVYRFSMNGWWLSVSPETLDGDHQRLIGFLSTNPSQDKINAYFHMYHTGERLVWFNIPDIVKTLEERFPKEERIDEKSG